MRLIDVSYFSKAPHVIANASGIAKSAMENAAAKVIEDLIDEHHDCFIRDVIGCGADEVVRELGNSSSWDMLGGEVKAIAESLIEPFGKFMYFQILRNSQSIAGITGVYQLVSSDKSISPRALQTHVWNDMVRQLRRLSADYNWDTKCNLLTYVNPYNI